MSIDHGLLNREYDPEDGHDDVDDCPICGGYMETESCWACHGEGGYHDCGEDCCCCLHPETNVACPECNGRGSYSICTSIESHAEILDARKAKEESGR